jgi:hypothetical protein
MTHQSTWLMSYYRSDDAYNRAAMGDGNADGYTVVETGVNGITATKSANKVDG